MKRKYDRARFCSYCGCNYEGYPGKPKGENTFCSNECRCKWLGESNKTKRVNQPGGFTAEEKAKIRESQLGKGTKDSYPKYYGRHEHRVVAEKMLGRSLKENEVVHHIDKNKKNNHPSNLMVFRSQSEHIRWHLENDMDGGGKLG